MDKILSPIKQRVIQFIESQSIVKDEFYKKTSISASNFKGIGAKSELGGDKIVKILTEFPIIRPDWLVTGEGGMLKTDSSNEVKLIPFYSDVASMGGRTAIAESSAVYETTDYINAGDLFPGATAAIRHYNDSMTEYPPGCILALAQLHVPYDFMWGQDYVIEYSEYRVTKKVQKGSKGIIKACSTNETAYADGRQIHEPIDIRIDEIRRLFLVLGYIVRKHGERDIIKRNK